MSELKVERKENMCGGEGHILIKHILGEKELNGKCGLYAEVTIEPGCSLGYHEHHNEVRHIISCVEREIIMIMV